MKGQRGRPKKEESLTISAMPKDLLDWFRAWCNLNQDTMSGHLKRYILSLKRREEQPQQERLN
jgi:hypothetical protein